MKTSRSQKVLALFICCVMALGLVACSKDQSKTDGSKQATNVTTAKVSDKDTKATGTDNAGKKKIYTSIYPMYFLTSRIAGDKAVVENLVPSGTEAHDWEPSTEDIVKLSDADMLVYNGAGMEHWVSSIGDSVKNDKLTLVEASKGLDLIKNEEEHEHEHEHDHDADAEHDHDHEHDHDADAEHDHDHEHEEGEEGHHHHHHHHGEWDPHVWTAPLMAKGEAQNILNALVELDKDNAETYKANFEKLATDLDNLDKEFQEALKNKTRDEIVTNHSAFAYLAKAYGLKQMGITGVYADKEPSPQKMADIVDFVKEHKVKVIFAEEILSPKVSEAIASEAGAEVKVLSPVESLSTEEVQNGDDYITVMKKNIEALKQALVD